MDVGEPRSKGLDPEVKHQIQILERMGCSNIGLPDVTCDDWSGTPIIVEFKHKALFTAGRNYPHDAIGMNLTQFTLRWNFFQKTGARTLLVNETPNGDVYYEFLDVLMKGDYWDSPGQIRLFPVKNFHVWKRG